MRSFIGSKRGASVTGESPRSRFWSGVVAITTAIVLSVILIPKPPSYAVGGSGAAIEGVEKIDNTSTPVETPVAYAQTPPAGGSHSPAWLNCGIYNQAVPNENAVHSLEHGAIRVTYDPSVAARQLDKLRSKFPRTQVILSPYDGLRAPIVLSGWNVQLGVENADDSRTASFFEEYWNGENAPEPGASCIGGISG